jgi:exosortase E/protease (VPEID-CTERM system)
LLRVSGTLMPLSAAIGAALILVCWARPGTFDFPFRAGRAAWLDAVLQLASFAGLFALTKLLFAGSAGGARANAQHVGWLVAAWLFAVVVTGLMWLRIGLPMRFLPRVLRRRAGLLVVACALGAAAYAVGRMAQGFWLPLRQATFVAASAVLRGLVDDAIVEPADFVLGHRDFAVEIAPQCSGYEGVGLSWVFLGTALWLFRKRLRFPRAFWVLAIGTVAPWLANVFRLAALVLVGSYVSADLALGAFHSYAGALLFCGIALGTVWFALRSPWLAAEGHAAEGPATNPASPYLLPFLAMLLAGLLAKALSNSPSARWLALRLVVGALALAVFLPSYRSLFRRPSWLALASGMMAAGLWLVLDAAAGGMSRGAHGGPADGALSMFIRAASAIAIAPFVEELAFRGFLARRLVHRDFDLVAPARLSPVAVIISSLAFGLLHHRPVAGTLAGVCYALVYRRRGQLSDAVLAHATTNAVLVVVAIVTGRTDLWT